MTQSVSIKRTSDLGKVWYKWFLGMLSRDELVSRGWGRDLGKPERNFVPTDKVSPEILEAGYYRLMEQGRPVYQSISYYRDRNPGSLSETSGALVALEKVFFDIDVDSVDKIELAREEAKQLYDYLRSYGEPLIVFSGKKGFHLYMWLPQVLEDTGFYKYIVRALGVGKLKLRFLDTKVLEPARLSRVPYTLHHETKEIVAPLDSDFRPISAESFNIDYYTARPMCKEVLDKAFELREAQRRLELTRKYWMNMDLLSKPYRALRSKKLPDIVEWLLEHGAEEGYRNNAAFIIATWLMNKGYSFDQTMKTLREWNKKNKPPLPEKEIEYVVNSVYKHKYKPVSKKKAMQWIKK